MVATRCGLMGPTVLRPVEAQFNGVFDGVGQVEQVAYLSDG
jgi:hypothetical protein